MSTVASCLIELNFSVDAYPNQLPDLMCVRRISMNQVWESMKDLSMNAVASGLLTFICRQELRSLSSRRGVSP